MNKQFVHFYLLVVLSSCALIWALAKLYQGLVPAEPAYQITAEQLFNSPQLSFSEVPLNSLQLPAALEQKLANNETLALQMPDLTTYFYRYSDTGQLLQAGPVNNWQHQDSPDFSWLFYSALALLFMVILWPLFRDIQRLSKLTLAFSEQPNPIKANISRHSSLSILANKVELMSERICSLLQQQQHIARTITHETRTPLSRIKFTLSLCGEQMPLKYQRTLQRDIAEIDQLMQDYLDFSRLDYMANKTLQPLATEPWLAAIRDNFDVYQHEFQLEFHNSVAHMHFIADAMTLAVNNLLSNALRYANSTITLSLQQAAGYYCLTVQDDGPGFVQNSQLLTQAFSTGDSKAGYGLGLYIVNQVVLWHGGQLTLSNQHGAVVQLRWPVPAAAIMSGTVAGTAH
ncbi:ATP-binding protein [Arsukibacterium sp.]|uniref:ATP-binding protein n=1 Tax=Arsukibacterium sp. TaxID=1977258 RepID=UPI002FD97E55